MSFFASALLGLSWSLDCVYVDVLLFEVAILHVFRGELQFKQQASGSQILCGRLFKPGIEFRSS